MNKSLFRGFKLGVVAFAATVALSACTSTLSDVKSDGTATDITWPDPKSNIMSLSQGTYPNLQSLAQVTEGLGKKEIMKLIGHPQHAEGIFMVREWDYLFRFTTPNRGVNGVTTCQFKITFDNNMQARSFFWNKVDPDTDACPPPIHALATYELSTDALFKFDRSGLGDINPKGRENLRQIADQIKRMESVESLTVVAHADRIGSDSYNQKLSERRALTVKRFFASEGIPANMINAVGMGSRQPVVQCDNTNRVELIRCLHPNRRVEITVNGKGTYADAENAKALSK